MSCLLEMLGRGLEKPFMDLILPFSQPLTALEAELLSKEVERRPEHTANKLRLGIHYAQSGASERAENLFGKIIEQDPGHLDTRLARAAMHMSEGGLNEALQFLQEAYEKQNCDSRVMYGLGHCYERQGHLPEAMRYYHEAAGSSPYLRHATERLAAIYLQANDYPRAIGQYSELQKEHPEDVAVYLFLGQMHLRTGQYQEATTCFERAITIEPDNFELHDDYVESLVKAGRLPEAIQKMQKIAEEQGEFPDNYVRLGDLYTQMGDDEAAVKNYKRGLELHPGYLEAAVKLGTQHLRMGRFYEAASNFNRAIEINDQLILAYVGLGIAQKYSRQEEEARDTLDLASALEPNTNLLFAETARLQLKVALAQRRQPGFFSTPSAPQVSAREMDDLLDLQIERHRQSLEGNPNHADLRYRYGLLLRGRGKPEEAISHFRAAVEINPSYVKARLKLGLALREQGQPDAAVEQLREALRARPEHVDLHYKLALMYCDKIQFALAVEHFELAQQSATENINVHANLALALQNMGLIDRARATWQAICELEPESPLAFKAQREAISLKPIW